MTATTVCPLCNSPATDDVCVKTVDQRAYRLVRCSRCQLVFVADPPTADELRAYYDHLWREERDPQRRGEAFVDQQLRAQRFQRRLNELARLTTPGRVLDLGCKDGLFLALAQQRGWQPQGLELTVEAAQQAQQRGLPVAVGAVAELHWPEASFDVVTVWHLIEHVTDPLTLLRDIHRLLKPGGLLAIETPNIASRAFRHDGAAWEYLAPPQHLCYFNDQSLRHALTQAGYQPLQTRYEGGTGMGRQLAEAGLGGLRLWLRRHYRYLQSLRAIYVALFGWLAPTDDVLILYARTTSRRESS